MEVIGAWGMALINLTAFLLQQNSTSDTLPLTILGGIVTIVVGLFAAITSRSTTSDKERGAITTIALRNINRIDDLEKAELDYRSQISDLQSKNAALQIKLAAMTQRAEAAEANRDKPLPTQGLQV